jgi:hypothetical protein
MGVDIRSTSKVPLDADGECGTIPAIQKTLLTANFFTVGAIRKKEMRLGGIPRIDASAGAGAGLRRLLNRWLDLALMREWRTFSMNLPR